MNSQTHWLWHDGEVVPSAEAVTHVMTHSLHYGVSAIEGIRAHRLHDGSSAIFRVGDHMRRLFATAKAFNMTLPYSPETLMQSQGDLLARNGLAAAYLRPIAYYGPEKRGLYPMGAQVHVAIDAFAWDGGLSAQAYTQGLRARTSTFTRPSPLSTATRAKVSSLYATSILAKVEAVNDGYDEALLLDPQGHVAETSGANVFIVWRGQLVAADSPSALLGITRDTVRELATDRGISLAARCITRDEVYQADEAFLTGTAVGIVPIVELDRRKIGAAVPGPLTQQLMAAYADAVSGRDLRHHDWLYRLPHVPTEGA